MYVLKGILLNKASVWNAEEFSVRFILRLTLPHVVAILCSALLSVVIILQLCLSLCVRIPKIPTYSKRLKILGLINRVWFVALMGS